MGLHHIFLSSCSLIRHLGQTVCKPGSVPAMRVMAIHLGRSLPSASRDLPGQRRGNPPVEPVHMPPLFGLAPGGVCHAVAVAGDAVRSYRTLSPLPAAFETERRRRYALCGTFPGVTPAGCYPAPCFRGARTFLPPAGFPWTGERPSDRLAVFRLEPGRRQVKP